VRLRREPGFESGDNVSEDYLNEEAPTLRSESLVGRRRWVLRCRRGLGEAASTSDAGMATVAWRMFLQCLLNFRFIFGIWDVPGVAQSFPRSPQRCRGGGLYE